MPKVMPLAGDIALVMRSPYAVSVKSGQIIDPGFDVRMDANGKDPDSHSKTLHRYHQLLWSKPLPSGQLFELDARLHHKSYLGEYWLTSDSIVHTYTRWRRPAHLVNVIGAVSSEETRAFFDLACTVGAYLVFPTQARVDGKWDTVDQPAPRHASQSAGSF